MKKILKTSLIAFIYYVVTTFLSLWLLASINLASIFGTILLFICPLIIFVPTILYIIIKLFNLKFKEDDKSQ